LLDSEGAERRHRSAGYGKRSHRRDRGTNHLQCSYTTSALCFLFFCTVLFYSTNWLI